jgi:hypothetical protein
MAAATYHKGQWRADVDVEELASGKFEGIVLLFHEGEGAAREQVVHRTVDAFDTADGALAEAKILAHRILGDV